MIASIFLYMGGLKKYAFLVAFGVVLLTLFANIGLSWQSGYNNRVQINVSTLYDDFNNVAMPIILNNTILGADACADTVYCNDSLTTYLNDTPIYYYNDEYNASANWRLFVSAPAITTTDNFSIYFYYNSTNVTHNAYFSGNNVFTMFYDFENYSVNDPPSGHFGSINVDNENITATACFDGKCLINSGQGGGNGDIIFGGISPMDFLNTIAEFRAKYAAINIGVYWTSSFCSGTFPCGYSGGAGNIYPVQGISNNWDKIVYTQTNTNGNLTINGVLKGNIGLSSTPRGIDYGYTADNVAIDNVILRDLIEDPLQVYISTIENAPPVTDDFLILNYINPDFLNISENCDNITMTINPQTSEYPILNCSLWLNDTLNYTENQPLNDSAVSTSLNLANGSYGFYWDCYAGDLYNTTINYTLNVMCAYPAELISTATACPACLNCVPTRQYCADNTTLYQEIYRSVTVNGLLTTCNETRLIDCPYGCNSKTNACALSTYEAWINNGALFIGVLVAFIVVVMAGRKAKGIRF